MAGVAGFEPTLTVLETVALPLNYTPVYLSDLKHSLNACLSYQDFERGARIPLKILKEFIPSFFPNSCQTDTLKLSLHNQAFEKLERRKNKRKFFCSLFNDFCCKTHGVFTTLRL